MGQWLSSFFNKIDNDKLVNYTEKYWKKNNNNITKNNFNNINGSFSFSGYKMDTNLFDYYGLYNEKKKYNKYRKINNKSNSDNLFFDTIVLNHNKYRSNIYIKRLEQKIKDQLIQDFRREKESHYFTKDFLDNLYNTIDKKINYTNFIKENRKILYRLNFNNKLYKNVLNDINTISNSNLRLFIAVLFSQTLQSIPLQLTQYLYDQYLLDMQKENKIPMLLSGKNIIFIDFINNDKFIIINGFITFTFKDPSLTIENYDIYTKFSIKYDKLYNNKLNVKKTIKNKIESIEYNMNEYLVFQYITLIKYDKTFINKNISNNINMSILQNKLNKNKLNKYKLDQNKLDQNKLDKNKLNKLDQNKLNNKL